MTRCVFASKKEAEVALELLERARTSVTDGDTIESAQEANRASSGRTASRSTLHRCIRKPKPFIAKTRSGFYLKKTPKTSSAFSENEEKTLVERVVGDCTEKGHIEALTVSLLARNLRDEIFADGGAANRKRLLKCKFSRDWTTAFLSKHSEELSRKVPRPVDNVCYISHNDTTISKFFAQVHILFAEKRITRVAQVCNFDETGFTPGRDLTGVRKKRVVTMTNIRAVSARAPFRYVHLISVLVAVFADRFVAVPAACFRGHREPTVSDGVSWRKVSELVPGTWRAYWRKETASFDMHLFGMWVKEFVPVARRHVREEEWIVLFYDGLRAHFSYTVVELLKRYRIAVVALPAHTSDRLQPLDLAVFDPVKRFTNVRITKSLAHWQRMAPGNVALSAINVWNAIKGGVVQGLSVSYVLYGFSKAGLWPLNESAVVHGAIRSSKQDDRLLLPIQLERLVRNEVVCLKRHRHPPPKVQGGFVCTENGVELTRDDVMSAIREAEATRKARREHRVDDEMSRRNREAIHQAKRRAWFAKSQESKAHDRVCRYGEAFNLPRSFRERGEVARQLRRKKQQQLVEGHIGGQTE